MAFVMDSLVGGGSAFSTESYNQGSIAFPASANNGDVLWTLQIPADRKALVYLATNSPSNNRPNMHMRFDGTRIMTLTEIDTAVRTYNFNIVTPPGVELSLDVSANLSLGTNQSLFFAYQIINKD